MALPHRWDELRPVLRFWALAGPLAPRALEDRAEQQHRHVTTNAVALFGDVQHGLETRTSHPRVKRVQLEHLGPRGKVRVASAGIHPAVDLEERARIVA